MRRQLLRTAAAPFLRAAPFDVPSAALCLLVAGCGSDTGSAHAGTPDDPWVVGRSQCNLGEPWRVQMDADVRAAAGAHPSLESNHA
ncbi:MAG: hypothetical protein ABIF09_02565 [Gemmatimonadota bacterium]